MTANPVLVERDFMPEADVLAAEGAFYRRLCSEDRGHLGPSRVMIEYPGVVRGPALRWLDPLWQAVNDLLTAKGRRLMCKGAIGVYVHPMGDPGLSWHVDSPDDTMKVLWYCGSFEGGELLVSKAPVKLPARFTLAERAGEAAKQHRRGSIESVEEYIAGHKLLMHSHEANEDVSPPPMHVTVPVTRNTLVAFHDAYPHRIKPVARGLRFSVRWVAFPETVRKQWP